MTTISTERYHLLPTVVDSRFSDIEIGQTRDDWLQAMRQTLGREVADLTPVDSKYAFVLTEVDTGKGRKILRYTRVDWDDFGTTVHDPQKFGLPPVIQGLERVLQQKEAEAHALDMGYKTKECMLPLRGTVEAINRICTEVDADDFVDREFLARIDQATSNESVCVVKGASVLALFGALSAAKQKEHAESIVDKLAMDDTTKKDFYTHIRTIAASHEDTDNLREALADIHSYEPNARIVGVTRETFQAWMCAYAIGVASRKQIETASHHALKLDQQVQSIVRAHLEAES